jgi:hypothetical protein
LARLRFAARQIGLERRSKAVAAPSRLVARWSTLAVRRSRWFLRLVSHSHALMPSPARVMRAARGVNRDYSPTLSSMLCARMTATARLAAYSGA